MIAAAADGCNACWAAVETTGLPDSRVHAHFERGASRRRLHSIQTHDASWLIWNNAGRIVLRCYPADRNKFTEDDSAWRGLTQRYQIIEEGILEASDLRGNSRPFGIHE